mmetsp:Transcript_31606/g.28002  ORF Transcript_31606/g.28002 Transcript_31606/m.28002 type:complete len:113 (-) Transcript_31606:948-1286(-)
MKFENNLGSAENQTHGAFLFDINSKSMIKNRHKMSTKIKTTTHGVSFHNSKSFIPMQFSSRDQEMRAQRFLSTMRDPGPDQMIYEEVKNDVEEQNLFEQYARKHNKQFYEDK